MRRTVTERPQGGPQARYDFRDSDDNAATLMEGVGISGGRIWLGGRQLLDQIRVSPPIHPECRGNWESLRHILPAGSRLSGAQLCLDRRIAGEIGEILLRFHKTGKI